MQLDPILKPDPLETVKSVQASNRSRLLTETFSSSECV